MLGPTIKISYISCTARKTEYKHKKKRTRDLQANNIKRFINAEPKSVPKTA
jgi:hypothetical protein